MTTDPYEALPQFYDELLVSLHWAREHARGEGWLLVAEVFEDAATAATSLAGDLRTLAEGKTITVPGERDLAEVLVELDSLAYTGLSREEALAQVFPPMRRLPGEVGPCILCIEEFVPGDIAVNAPSEDAIGFAHLECLSVVIVDEHPATPGDLA